MFKVSLNHNSNILSASVFNLSSLVACFKRILPQCNKSLNRLTVSLVIFAYDLSE